MKVIYWDVVRPVEIGKPEYRKEIEIADGLRGSEAAIAASEKVDALDFPGPSIGEVATNHFEVDGFLYRVDKEVVVQRIWKPCGEAQPTKQLDLPPLAPSSPTIEDRVIRVIRAGVPDAGDLSPLTPINSLGDSLALLELAMNLEGEFGFGEIADEVVADWQTIGDVVKCVERMMLEQGTARADRREASPRPGLW